MRSAFVATLIEMAAQNDDIWLLCGDLGYSVLESFATRFPKRFCNVGVAEQNMVGVAAGLASTGKTVFVYSIGNFPTFRCLEQLRNDVCYHQADVKVVSVGAGYAYGSHGYTHHALEDLAVIGVLPGIEVFVPCDPRAVRTMTRLICGSRMPAYLRLSRNGEPMLTQVESPDPRRAEVLLPGADVLIMACGPIARSCLDAVPLLAARGLRAGVASIGCLKPLDESFVYDAARRYRGVVTVEEHVLRGGLYAAVSACVARLAQHAPILGLAVSEPAGKVSLAGSREVLLHAEGLDPESIAARIIQQFQVA